MLKKFVIIAGLFLACNAYCQTYEFDYVLEEEYTVSPDYITQHIYQYTNSKNNSYILTVKETNNEILSLFLLDREKQVAVGTISKTDFFDVDSHLFKCDAVHIYRNTNKKEQIKNYNFITFEDTIINAVAYNHYALKSDAKRAKRKNVGVLHYITHKDMPFYTPTLLPDPATYEEWKATKNIPYGVYKKHYILMPDGKKMQVHNLISYKKCLKNMILEICDTPTYK